MHAKESGKDELGVIKISGLLDLGLPNEAAIRSRIGEVWIPASSAHDRVAGVEERATIETADMRKLPFEAGAFDVVVGAHAIDHLNREGIDPAFVESDRVEKSGGGLL